MFKVKLHEKEIEMETCLPAGRFPFSTNFLLTFPNQFNKNKHDIICFSRRLGAENSLSRTVCTVKDIFRESQARDE